VITLTLLMWPSAARAENMYAESLDWLAADADLAARGRVADLGDRVRITDVVAIRGEGPTELTVDPNGCAPIALHEGEHVIVFLRGGPDGWTPRCAVERAQKWVISLTEPRGAYTFDGAILTTDDAIVAYVAATASRPVAHATSPAPTAYERFGLQQGPMSVEIFDSPAGRELWGGSAVYLAVPPYEDLRAGILEQSRSARPDEREDAARKLANYPGPEVEARLRELLADPYVAEWISEGRVVDRTHPVREAAWRSLGAHGADRSGLEDPTRR